MIIVTGAAGFIGSCFVNKLNNKGIKDIVVVDDFLNPQKNKNLEKKAFYEKIHRDLLFNWLEDNYKDVDFFIHIGARTDTAEFDKSVFDKLNLHYSQSVWNYCISYDIPLIYASSAATYGLGENGYKDDMRLIKKLNPLNPYGESKNDFDKWVIDQEEKPKFWAGLKFFNVYGPNEYHKGRMASVIWHAYQQILDTNKMMLFRSHNPDFEDGKQLRDFIYVKDVVDVIYYLMEKQPKSSIYNLGTGKARTFLDLVNNTFKAMDREPDIEFIDTPEDIRDKYQYFTEASMTKLLNTGYNRPFYSLEEGIEEYVREFLVPGRYF
ncbi:MAG TPA: ADP-glyceromanno-heptose 6-epimerase [Bacteroidales bacterium]|nr:ADP-glyceromanno-heptose 6-epimerase [Bacteroidales bacterium]HRX95640.1 ADP-glyceromanno-heptose 6-epimerase [Bacteroidales bacterium]